MNSLVVIDIFVNFAAEIPYELLRIAQKLLQINTKYILITTKRESYEEKINNASGMLFPCNGNSTCPDQG